MQTINGFQNPCLRHMRPPICLKTLLVHSASSCFFTIAPNSLGDTIASGDVLIVHTHYLPSTSDILLVEQFGEIILTKHCNLVSDEEIHCLGVVTASVRDLRSDSAAIESLTPQSLHDYLMGDKPYAASITRARGSNMAPDVNDGDLAIIERHLDLRNADIALFSISRGPLVCRRYEESSHRLLSNDTSVSPTELSQEAVTLEGVISKIIRQHRVGTR